MNSQKIQTNTYLIHMKCLSDHSPHVYTEKIHHTLNLSQIDNLPRLCQIIDNTITSNSKLDNE